ncbi:Microtubule-associated protein futsch, partial [Pseudolycoriella hygida]
MTDFSDLTLDSLRHNTETGSHNLMENGGQNGDTEPSSLVGMGPPSPLTGCYLLVILGEPHSTEHKDIILQKLVKGFLSWDALHTHVDLEDELNTITEHAPEGEDARH